MLAAGADPRASLSDTPRGSTSSARSQRFRRGLVTSEVALAIVLLVGAGLLLRSWWNVTNVDPAFRPERVLMVELSTPTTLHAETLREVRGADAGLGGDDREEEGPRVARRGLDPCAWLVRDGGREGEQGATPGGRRARE